MVIGIVQNVAKNAGSDALEEMTAMMRVKKSIMSGLISCILILL